MEYKSVVGGHQAMEAKTLDLDKNTAHQTNGDFWDTIGSDVLGVTALPNYGAFISEETVQLLEDVQCKKILEIGCGNGRSLKYLAEKKAAELWGIDLSSEQIKRTQDYLTSLEIKANLICSPMEEDCGVPKEYFDFVYAIYALGWTTDLDKTIQQIHSYLKKDGTFIFSWSHPIHKCVSIEKEKLIFNNSYFDESWYSTLINDKEIMLSNRKLSTYINALANHGFMIEKLIEENDEAMLSKKSENSFEKKAKMLPVTFIIKARKL
ncbi:MAG: class I SAM-dependent methyltransferase [Beduini sp.]|uniref:class I SAM-dependent methyltransferase n=1 Tax=Beduini sp. TaxID=1922300 RepID=UPI0011C9A32E